MDRAFVHEDGSETSEFLLIIENHTKANFIFILLRCEKRCIDNLQNKCEFVSNESYFKSNEMVKPQKKPFLEKYHTFNSELKEVAFTETVEKPIEEIAELTEQITTEKMVPVTTTEVVAQRPIATVTEVTKERIAEDETTAPLNVVEEDTQRETSVEKLNYLKEQTNDKSSLEEDKGEWLNDDTLKVNNENAKINDDNKHVTLITVTIVIAIAIIIVIITLRFLKKNVRANESKVEKNIDKTTVSVYAKSIFHTPLPGEMFYLV